jgi:hypothetical protein
VGREEIEGAVGAKRVGPFFSLSLHRLVRGELHHLRTRTTAVIVQNSFKRDEPRPTPGPGFPLPAMNAVSQPPPLGSTAGPRPPKPQHNVSWMTGLAYRHVSPSSVSSTASLFKAMPGSSGLSAAGLSPRSLYIFNGF